MSIEVRNTTGQAVEVNDDGSGEYFVCSQQDLLSYTTEGWTLVSMVMGEFLGGPHQPNQYWDEQQKHYNTTKKPAPCVELRFLIRRGRDVEYAELRDAKIAAEHECSTAQLELGKVKDKLEAKQLALKVHDSELEDARNEIVTLYHGHDRQGERLAKMENEMAKVRTAIGDKAWKEFVDGDGDG